MHPFPSLSKNKLFLHFVHTVADVHVEQSDIFPPAELHFIHFLSFKSAEFAHTSGS